MESGKVDIWGNPTFLGHQPTFESLEDSSLTEACESMKVPRPGQDLVSDGTHLAFVFETYDFLGEQSLPSRFGSSISLFKEPSTQHFPNFPGPLSCEFKLAMKPASAGYPLWD